MKKFLATVLFAAATLTGFSAQAGAIDDAVKAGTLRVGMDPTYMPFEMTNKRGEIIGFEVDLLKAMAKAMGVKLELVPTNPANRIPLLTSGKADVVFASFTITDERAKVVDFTTPYFLVGQQFLAKKGALTDVAQLKDLRIGTEKGTTMESNLRNNYPQTKVVLYDDSPFALAALRNGNVQAITNDGVKLTAQWGTLPDKEKYEIPAITVSKEYLGAAVNKGDTRLLEALNKWLVEGEKNGRNLAVYNAWFGPDSKSPLPRLLKVGDAG